MKQLLSSLFTSYTGREPSSIEPLAVSGSNRKYYRISNGTISVIGAVGTNADENRAFFGIGRHFRSKGIRVPEIYAVSDDDIAYLQEDLGKTNLFDAVSRGRESDGYSPEEEALLLKAIAQLPRIQFEGADGLDFSICYPEPEYSIRTVYGDLNYFKFCFLNATRLEYNVAALDADFEKFAGELSSECCNAFMYRDFQARNIMLKDGEPYFIDFQGGRRGPYLYDLASFVWQAKARYPEELRQKMTDIYFKELKRYTDADEDALRRRLRLFVLFRTLQVLGAYGFRGYFERKPHFLQSIPFAIANLRQLTETPLEDYPYLADTLRRMTELPQFSRKGNAARPFAEGLTVEVYSFSYKKGIPEDISGNGGGYVFDCRSIHNPGKYEQYRELTGTDKEVMDFLEAKSDISDYLGHVRSITDRHVETFIQRGFSHLMISFGCTGGQHRSVYCAEHTAKHISEKFGVHVVLNHRERGITKDYPAR